VVTEFVSTDLLAGAFPASFTVSTRPQRRVAVKTSEEVLRLYQERYFDLSVRHFHEKLKAELAIELSYT